MGASATGFTAGSGGKGAGGGRAASPTIGTPSPGQYSPMAPTSGFNVNQGAGGGTAASSTIGTPSPGQYSPMAPTSGFNVNQAAAGSLEQAMNTAGGLADFQTQEMQAAGASPTETFGGATVAPAQTYGGATVERTQGPQAAQLAPAERMQGVGAVRAANAPGQIDVGQIRTADISQYMNPYQQQVIDAGQADIERQRQMASENLSAQAQRAGAFGGSRQAVQEGVLAGEALRQAGALSAQQRQSGFQQAVESGKFDIGQTQQARTLASQQGFQAEQLGQQAREAAAAREQAARAGNMQAANQFAVQQAQFEQQAGMTSSAQDAARAAQQANLTQGAGLAGAAAQNAVSAQQAGLTQGAGLANQAAINQAIQAQAGRQQGANQANFGGQFQAAGIHSGAAGQLGLFGQQAFNTGQTIQRNQMQQGLMQQGLQQALIDAARGQYTGYTGSPATSLSAPLAALGVAGPNSGGTTTNTTSPGLFDYLGLGFGMAASDPRLKTNVTSRGEVAGIKVYDWDWNDEGKRIADPDQPTFGVMADELQATHPHLVSRGDDGYLRVNYVGLVAELEAA